MKLRRDTVLGPPRSLSKKRRKDSTGRSPAVRDDAVVETGRSRFSPQLLRSFAGMALLCHCSLNHRQARPRLATRAMALQVTLGGPPELPVQAQKLEGVPEKVP